MTVRELIEKLSQIENQETRVMINGYEGGVNDINNIASIVDVVLDVNDEWYYGKHERVDDIYESTNSDYHIVKAIIL